MSDRQQREACRTEEGGTTCSHNVHCTNIIAPSIMTQVKFRLVVFKPFVGEVIVARLKSCSREGLHLSLGFFDDILIPEHLLQEPSFYEDHEKVRGGYGGWEAVRGAPKARQLKRTEHF